MSGTAKRCNVCQRDLPVSAFHPKRGTCAECRNERQRAYYAANRERVSEYERQRRAQPARAAYMAAYRTARRRSISGGRAAS